MLDVINGSAEDDDPDSSKRRENAMAQNEPTDRSQPDRRTPLDLSQDKTEDGLKESLDRLQDSARSGWHSNGVSLGSTSKFRGFFQKKAAGIRRRPHRER